jgi:hypothetical protein
MEKFRLGCEMRFRHNNAWSCPRKEGSREVCAPPDAYPLFEISIRLHQRHCERSEAIHRSSCCGMDCFVASAPRNDVDGLARAADWSRSPDGALAKSGAGLTRFPGLRHRAALTPTRGSIQAVQLQLSNGFSACHRAEDPVVGHGHEYLQIA